MPCLRLYVEKGLQPKMLEAATHSTLSHKQSASKLPVPPSSLTGRGAAGSAISTCNERGEPLSDSESNQHTKWQ